MAAAKERHVELAGKPTDRRMQEQEEVPGVDAPVLERARRWIARRAKDRKRKPERAADGRLDEQHPPSALDEPDGFGRRHHVDGVVLVHGPITAQPGGSCGALAPLARTSGAEDVGVPRVEG